MAGMIIVPMCGTALSVGLFAGGWVPLDNTLTKNNFVIFGGSMLAAFTISFAGKKLFGGHSGRNIIENLPSYMIISFCLGVESRIALKISW